MSQGAEQPTNNPTRPQNNNMSLLDHLYTNIDKQKFNTHCPPYDMSGHLPILTILNSFKLQDPKKPTENQLET